MATVDTDGVVTLQIHCQTQLGTDAVGAGDQYRLAVFLRQCAQRAESAQSPITSGRRVFFTTPLIRSTRALPASISTPASL